MKGRISHPVVSLVRKQLGLIGNQPGKPRTAAKAKSARRMARTSKSANKSGFVKEFLSSNPHGNVKAVNDAWAAAGMKGTIGDSLIYELKKQFALSGKSKPRIAKPKSAPVSKTATTPGKSMFVKEFLNDNPQGNVKAVNEAWQAAGFDGTISLPLVDKMRASMGLTGNLRGNTRKVRAGATGKKRATPRQVTAAPVSLQSRTSNSDRTVELNDLEADIDRLLFKVMGMGHLTEIEDSLRQARRLLYGALARG